MLFIALWLAAAVEALGEVGLDAPGTEDEKVAASRETFSA
jgi:hypothetical protein